MLDFQLYLRSLSQSQDLVNTKRDAVDTPEQNAGVPYREAFDNYLRQATQEQQSSLLSTQFSPLKELPELKVAAQIVSQHHVFSALAQPSSWAHKNNELKTHQTMPADKGFLYQVFAVEAHVSNVPNQDADWAPVDADVNEQLPSEAAHYVLFLTANALENKVSAKFNSAPTQQNVLPFQFAELPSFSSMGNAFPVPLSYQSSAFISLPVAPGVLVVLEKGDLSNLAEGEVFQNVLRAYDALKETKPEVASALMRLMTKVSLSPLVVASPEPAAVPPDVDAPVASPEPAAVPPDVDAPVASPEPAAVPPDVDAPVASPEPAAVGPDVDAPVASPAPVAVAPDVDAPVASPAPVAVAPDVDAPVASPAPVAVAPDVDAPVASPGPATVAPDVDAPVASPGPAPVAPDVDAPVASPGPATVAPDVDTPVASPAPATVAPDVDAPVASPGPAAVAPDVDVPVTSPAPVVVAPEVDAPVASPTPVAVASPAPAAVAPDVDAPVASPGPATVAPDVDAPVASPGPAAVAPDVDVPVTSPAPVVVAPEVDAPVASPTPVAVASPAPAAVAPDVDAPVASPAPVAVAPEVDVPVASPAPAAVAPEVDAPVASPGPAAVAPDVAAPVASPGPAAVAPDVDAPVASPAPVAVAPEVAAPVASPAPVAVAPDVDAPVASPAPAAVAPGLAALQVPESIAGEEPLQQASHDTVVQLASLPFIAFYAVQVKPQQEHHKNEHAEIVTESSPELMVQQNVFLYRLVASHLEQAFSQGKRTRGVVGRVQEDSSLQQDRPFFSWSVFERPAGLDTQLSETPFQPVLDTWLKGALKLGEASVTGPVFEQTKVSASQSLQISEVKLGQLSSARVEPDALQQLMKQSTASEELSSMTFADFMSVHEIYESVLPVSPTIESDALLSPDSSLSSRLESDLFTPLLNLNAFSEPTGLSFSQVVKGLVHGLAELGVQVSGLRDFSALEKVLPPDVRIESFTSSPRGERVEQRQPLAQDSTVSQETSATQTVQRMNLSASQVIQAINQNVPVHIADFPAFVSRALQVQPPSVTQPQALQVTLSPDSLGKITAQFELTAQNTVNITFLSQSAMTVDKIGSYLQEIQQIIGSTQFAPGQIMVRQGIPLAKQSQSFDQQSQSERDSDDEQQKIQRRGGQRRRRSDDEEISIDVTV